MIYHYHGAKINIFTVPCNTSYYKNDIILQYLTFAAHIRALWASGQKL
jgi:hypothetical protein